MMAEIMIVKFKISRPHFCAYQIDQCYEGYQQVFVHPSKLLAPSLEKEKQISFRTTKPDHKAGFHEDIHSQLQLLYVK